MNATIVYQNSGYQVVDARDWKMGFTVDKRKEFPDGKAGYVTIKTNLTKTEAIRLADDLQRLS